MKFNKDSVFRGAVLALENARELLLDASVLIENGRYPRATVLAIFAREELGRHAFLMQQWVKMDAHTLIGHAELASLIENHAEKLRAGQTSIPLHLPQQLLERFKRACMGQSSDEERRAVSQEVEQLSRRVARRHPADVHDRRIRSLYVDPTETGAWVRPSDEAPDTAETTIMAVSVDYSNHQMRLVNGWGGAGSVAGSVANEMLPAFDYTQVGERVVNTVLKSRASRAA